MTNVKLNWAMILAVLSGLGGAVGLIVTPIWGTHMTTQVQAVVAAVSALLVAISGYHATSVVTSTAKAKASARLSAEAPPS